MKKKRQLKGIFSIILSVALLLSQLVFAPAQTVLAESVFVKGINFNGNAVTIEGNQWLSYNSALADGLNVNGASTYSGTRTWSPTPPNADFQNMLDSVVYKSGATLNLTQTIANGNYEIYVWLSENYQNYARSIDLKLEGNTVASSIGNMTNNTWQKYGPYSVTVSDGVLNMDLVRLTGDPQICGAAIFSTSGVTPAPTPTPTPTPTATSTPTPTPISGGFLKGINFNGNAVTIEGNQWLSYNSALADGLNVNGASTYSGTRTWSPTPPSQDFQNMLDSVVYKSGGTLNLTQTIANGNYEIYAWIGENYQNYARSVDLKLEGTTVASGIGNMSNNTWQKYGPYSVTVSDGVLNMDLVRLSGDPQICGLTIFTASGATPTPTPTPTATPTPTPTPTPGNDPPESQVVPPSYPTTVTSSIEVNQVGYLPGFSKTAVAASLSGSFYIVNSDTHTVAYTGTPSAPVYDSVNSVNRIVLDFSPVTANGNYYIRTSIGKSYTFRIQNGMYRDVGNALIKGLYLQRCGTAVTSAYAGAYTHAVCHTSMAELWGNPSVQVNVNGGWHDAGDYGKYIVTAANSVSYLLYAYELYGSGVSDSLNIPESGNSWPDILDEVKYELDWMLKMQAPSGGVYHKATTANFAAWTMPEYDTAKIYLSPISLTATADFAATMAAASRIYAPYNSAFSQSCLTAAVNAYNFAIANENMPGFTNPQGIVTGEYGDSNSYDEIYWAAAELYRATGNQAYQTKFISQYSKTFNKLGLDWQNVGGFGSLAYLLSSNIDAGIATNLRTLFINDANGSRDLANASPYGACLPGSQYWWGSNSGMSNKAMIMIIAGKLQNTSQNDDAIRKQIDYLLGHNILSKSYITGFGSNPPMNPHNRQSYADGVTNPLPGLLVGGPNSYLEDYVLYNMFGGVRPTAVATAYADNTDSYSTNENAINYSTSAIFVTGYINSKY